MRITICYRSLFRFLVLAAIIPVVCSCDCEIPYMGMLNRISGNLLIPKEIRATVSGMTVHEKASQVLMVSIDGNEHFPPYLYSHFSDTVPGAILLFKYNIADTPKGVHSYLTSCDDAFARMGAVVPVIYAIDHEGGDVYRTGHVTTRLPSAKHVADTMSVSRAQRLYELSGQQLAALGIRMNLAPVSEALTVSNRQFLGTRSYSTSPDVVGKYASAAVKGYRKAGIRTVLKHFPGNGAGDPHEGLPVLDASRDKLESVYIAPFRKTLASSPDAVLVSHIIVSAIDPGVPFCLSRKGVTGLLRKKLGFSGLVITDDISMSALASRGVSSGKTAVLALRAGCDMIMTSDSDVRSISSAIAAEATKDPVFMSRLDEAVTRILVLKERTGIIPASVKRHRDSRSKSVAQPVDFPVFDQSSYQVARKNADQILEETDGAK